MPCQNCTPTCTALQCVCCHLATAICGVGRFLATTDCGDPGICAVTIDGSPYSVLAQGGTWREAQVRAALQEDAYLTIDLLPDTPRLAAIEPRDRSHW
jgi:hypothetical protein